ncbi:MAG: hypothetical protein WCG87_04025 [Bacteroidota bacterium]
MRFAKALLAIGFVLLLGSFTTAAWDLFVSKEGNFRIRFPKEPKQGEKIVSGSIGQLNETHYLYTVGKFRDDNLTYDVGFVDYSDTLINTNYKHDLVDTFLSSVAYSAVHDIQGNVISLEKTHYKQYPGRHLKIDHNNGEMVVNMKIYLVKSRVYYLEVRCKPEKEKNPSIGNFFNSFEIIKP